MEANQANWSELMHHTFRVNDAQALPDEVAVISLDRLVEVLQQSGNSHLIPPPIIDPAHCRILPQLSGATLEQVFEHFTSAASGLETLPEWTLPQVIEEWAKSQQPSSTQEEVRPLPGAPLQLPPLPPSSSLPPPADTAVHRSSVLGNLSRLSAAAFSQAAPLLGADLAAAIAGTPLLGLLGLPLSEGGPAAAAALAAAEDRGKRAAAAAARAARIQKRRELAAARQQQRQQAAPLPAASAELQLLDEGDAPEDGKPPRAAKRAIKNRESAARSRNKRLEYTTALEAQVEQLRAQNKALRVQVITAAAAPPDPHAGALDGTLLRRMRTTPL